MSCHFHHQTDELTQTFWESKNKLICFFVSLLNQNIASGCENRWGLSLKTISCTRNLKSQSCKMIQFTILHLWRNWQIHFAHDRQMRYVICFTWQSEIIHLIGFRCTGKLSLTFFYMSKSYKTPWLNFPVVKNRKHDFLYRLLGMTGYPNLAKINCVSFDFIYWQSWLKFIRQKNHSVHSIPTVDCYSKLNQKTILRKLEVFAVRPDAERHGLAGCSDQKMA